MSTGVHVASKGRRATASKEREEDRVRALTAELSARTREITDERQFIAQVLNSLPVSLYAIDREYRVRVWNHARESGLQGIPRAAALGRTIFELLHRQPADALRREFDAVFETGQPQQSETESAAATGPSRHFRIRKIPMRLGGPGMPITHVITIGEDVTDAREAEARASHAEKLAALGEMAASVMHELNNPLATISACAEGLIASQSAEQPAPAVRGETYLNVIDAEVHRCKRIIEGLLDFARVRPAEKVRLEMATVAEQALSLISHQERFRRLTVQRELMPELFVQANVDRLTQVLLALLGNASDAMGDTGTIVVRVRRGNDATIVTEIADDGKGIPRTQLRRIFEPFFTTKAPGKGTGLGLSICYGIIAEHGGRIEVESTVGVGSVFRIVLPELI